MTPNLSLDSLPAGLLVAIGILAVVQITLYVIALTDLARRPSEQVTFGIKWPWVLIILLINLVGAVIYLGAGRRPAPAAEQPPAGLDGTSASHVADSLYGQRDGEPQ